MNDLFKKAFSLVLNKNGKVSITDVDSLLEHFEVDKNIIIDKSQFVEELKKAQKYFKQFDKCLFVCTNVTCQKSAYLEQNKSNLEQLSKSINCQVIETGCHWQCEKASVVTLKTGDSLKSYTKCNSQSNWSKSLDEIKSSLLNYDKIENCS